MWQRLGKFVLQYRLPLLVALLMVTGIMGYFAAKVKLSYEFSKAIPSDNSKYLDYVSFKEKFGDDGNMVVIGVQSPKLFTLPVFKAYATMQKQLKSVPNVEDILGIPTAITLVKDPLTDKLTTARIFEDNPATQEALDSGRTLLLNLPFYKYRLFNPETETYLMGVRIQKDSLNSPARTKIIAAITQHAQTFEKASGYTVHLSGLPLIRTVVADRVQNEMRLFLMGSLVLSVLILLLFFRSIGTALLSLLVVLIGVVWTMGILYLCGYKITLLTALAPPLVVVIGIPNCIYFVNKYHSAYLQHGDKNRALVEMVSKMGVVTLFCNITAAIGFAVFALTRSAILQEFGIVAGLSIMAIFVISFILLPASLSYLAAPAPRQMRYLDNRLLTRFLLKIEYWVIEHRKGVYLTTVALVLFSIAGIFRLKTVGYIVDDLPKTDKIYTDLKFFEKHFKGIMPLEIILDTKKPKGILRQEVDINKIAFFQDSFVARQKNIARPLSVIDGIKFSYQGISQGLGDSAYTLPGFGNPFAELHKSLREIQVKKANGVLNARDTALMKLMGSFVDSTEQYLRISMSMADMGTQALVPVIDSIQRNANRIINAVDSTVVTDTAALPVRVTITGTSSTFLEGSRYIINGLKESIFWAFLLISICMLYLFRSLRILLCSLLPNLVPLVITAGVMGWIGVPLKPSTVLIFSVALGIAIDITIRFLVNYKQELPLQGGEVMQTISVSIKQTGLSIVYTSLVLIVGFVIFCFSGFGGTQSLGWLTSLTLVVATITNLVLLPVLLKDLTAKKRKSK